MLLVAKTLENIGFCWQRMSRIPKFWFFFCFGSQRRREILNCGSIFVIYCVSKVCLVCFFLSFPTFFYYNLLKWPDLKSFSKNSQSSPRLRQQVSELYDATILSISIIILAGSSREAINEGCPLQLCWVVIRKYLHKNLTFFNKSSKTERFCHCKISKSLGLL